MNSKENTKYWLEKIREETISTTHIESARYVLDVVRTEINQIKTMENSQNKETDNQSEDADEEVTDYHEDDQNEIYEPEEDECTEAEPWILENGINVTNLFNEYYQRIEQFVKSESLIPLETHVQELSALNHILVLKPLQHSKMMREMFTDENIKYIINEQVQMSIEDKSTS